MPGPLCAVVPAELVGAFTCSDGHEEVRSRYPRCWFCGKPGTRIVKEPPRKPFEQTCWLVCANLVCEQVGTRYRGAERAPCPECGLVGRSA